MPVDVTVNGIEYVPGGVCPAPPDPPLVPPPPPVPPPELVQLATPRRTPSSASGTHIRSSCLRLRRMGSKSTPQASGITAQRLKPFGRSRLVGLPVETLTVTLPVTPPVKVCAGGLNKQSAFVGSASHAKANVPEEPFRGVRTSL